MRVCIRPNRLKLSFFVCCLSLTLLFSIFFKKKKTIINNRRGKNAHNARRQRHDNKCSTRLYLTAAQTPYRTIEQIDHSTQPTAKQQRSLRSYRVCVSDSIVFAVGVIPRAIDQVTKRNLSVNSRAYSPT